MVGLLSLTPVRAQAPEEPLSIQLTVRSVQVNDSGAEVLGAEDAAAPGDLLQYTAVYRNRSERPLKSIVPTLPVPQGMVYVAPMGGEAPVQASLDGQVFEAFPIRRPRQAEGRGVVLAEVPFSAYRAVRWSPRDLKPGEQFTTILRARIVNDSPKS